jgi:hypothetical protein
MLSAVNAGNPGSMAMIRINPPKRSIKQLALLVLKSRSNLSRDAERHYLRKSVYVSLRPGSARRVERVCWRSSTRHRSRCGLAYLRGDDKTMVESERRYENVILDDIAPRWSLVAFAFIGSLVLA